MRSTAHAPPLQAMRKPRSLAACTDQGEARFQYVPSSSPRIRGLGSCFSRAGPPMDGSCGDGAALCPHCVGCQMSLAWLLDHVGEAATCRDGSLVSPARSYGRTQLTLHCQPRRFYRGRCGKEIQPQGYLYHCKPPGWGLRLLVVVWVEICPSVRQHCLYILTQGMLMARNIDGHSMRRLVRCALASSRVRSGQFSKILRALKY